MNTSCKLKVITCNSYINHYCEANESTAMNRNNKQQPIRSHDQNKFKKTNNKTVYLLHNM